MTLDRDEIQRKITSLLSSALGQRIFEPLSLGDTEADQGDAYRIDGAPRRLIQIEKIGLLAAGRIVHMRAPAP
jgi:hypothetical protein